MRESIQIRRESTEEITFPAGPLICHPRFPFCKQVSRFGYFAQILFSEK